MPNSPRHFESRASILALFTLLASCGGGGGGGSSSTPPTPVAPTASLSVSTSDARIGGSATLTWTSTNALSCTASGDWSGTLATTGSQSIAITKAASNFTLNCSGAGGNANAQATITGWNAPTATLSLADTELLAQNTTTVTWSSTNAKSCRALSGLTDPIANSGSTSTPALAASTTYSIECSNPAYPPVSASSTVSVASTFDLTVTAKYQRPGGAVLNPSTNGYVPDWSNPIVAPIRNVYIELQSANGTKVAGTYASDTGVVVFSGLDPAVKYTPVLKSMAQNAKGFDIWVANNTAPISTSANTIRTRYAPYTDRAAEFTPNTRKLKQSLEITAPMGWDATAGKLVDANRISGPYAILADALEQQAYVAQNGAVNAINKVTILWSVTNKGGGPLSTYDLDAGLVPGSGGFSYSGAAVIGADGKQVVTAQGSENIPFIFLSGAQSFEPMEFAQLITVHEMTHYTQRQSQRNDSPGGPHSEQGEYQDILLVQHEGLATGTATLIAKSPRLERYRQSGGNLVVSRSDYTVSGTPLGWFQERTVVQLIWRLFDPTGNFKLSGPQILAPFYSDAWKNGTFGPNIWAYANILKTQQPALAGAIDALGTDLKITFAGNDVWGTQETLLGNRSAAQTLPIFTRIPTTGSTTVCSVGSKAQYNKLGNRRFLRFDGDNVARSYRITGATGTVPYIALTAGSTDIEGFRKDSNIVSTGTVTVPAAGGWGFVGECSVILGSDPAVVDRQCATTPYTAPEETCWTITAVP